MSQSRLKYELALLFDVLVWGINFPILKVALAAMHPFVVNLFRFIFSLLVLGALHAWTHRRDRTPFFEPLRTHGRAILLLGLLGYVIYQLAFIEGVHLTTSGSAALIMASAPLWTAVISQLRGYDRLNLLGWIGLLVSLLGTVVVVIYGPRALDFSEDALLGNLLMTGAAVAWGAYTALSQPFVHRMDPASLTFFGLLLAYPILALLGLLHLDAVVWADVDATIWAALIFSGALSTGLTVAFWNHAIRHVGPSHTAAFGNLVPVVALVAGYLMLGEPITPAQLLGGAGIIGGLLLMRRARRMPLPS
ncbi:DMT family transporter [Rhodothermus marinus]|uniref:DMT family transporter n=1 Tax=Rhodothermus marinus TaxID=29549 RepID=UPI0037C988C3